MDHGAYRQGLRQRIAQVFPWLLGRTQTHDHYRHSARHQADGYVRGQQDPDAGRVVDHEGVDGLDIDTGLLGMPLSATSRTREGGDMADNLTQEARVAQALMDQGPDAGERAGSHTVQSQLATLQHRLDAMTHESQERQRDQDMGY